MTEIFEILNGNLIIGFFVLIVVIPLYVKLGIFDRFFGKNGKNGNDLEHRIGDLEGHAKIANDEMKEIRIDISQIRSDISFIKGKLEQ